MSEKLDWRDLDTLPDQPGSKVFLWATSGYIAEPEVAIAVLGDNGQWYEIWDQLDGYHQLVPLKWAPYSAPE